MINTRYKKLKGMHAGHAYVVMAPASEIDNPVRWMLHSETAADEKLTMGFELEDLTIVYKKETVEYPKCRTFKGGAVTVDKDALADPHENALPLADQIVAFP